MRAFFDLPKDIASCRRPELAHEQEEEQPDEDHRQEGA